MERFGGFWAIPHLLLLAESSVGTLKLLRDSRNEASRYVSNPSLTAVLHTGALGPLDERCPGRVEVCGWGALLYNEYLVDPMIGVRKVCPGTPCSVLVIKRPRTHVCRPILEGGLQKPSALETPGSCAWGGHFPSWPSRLTAGQRVLVYFKIQVAGKCGEHGSPGPDCLCIL